MERRGERNEAGEGRRRRAGKAVGDIAMGGVCWGLQSEFRHVRGVGREEGWKLWVLGLDLRREKE